MPMAMCKEGLVHSVGIREVHFGVGGKRKKWGRKLIILYDNKGSRIQRNGDRKEIETEYSETTHRGQT